MTKDARLQVFRTTIDGLIESLEAVIRLSRWTEADGEAKPEPLVASAAKLNDLLGAANRLASSRFNGSATEVSKVEGICVVLRKLDAAWLTYRQSVDSPQPSAAALVDATALLETEVATATKSEALTWR